MPQAEDPRGADPVSPRGRSFNLFVDSTGIKFLGDGEWQARTHGSQRRRQWHKVHLAMDPATSDIRAVELRATRHYGRAFRKRWTGYHARSRIEAKMRCLKAFGERIAAKDPDRQTA